MFLSPFTKLNDKYTIISPIGQFPKANIYVARTEDNKDLILKEFILPDSSEKKNIQTKLLSQIDSIKTLTHSGLPGFFDSFSLNGKVYLVMEYVKGKNLEKVINSRKKQVPTDIALKWTIEILNTLHFLHTSFSSPALYNNLNPSNIIIDRENNVKLVDYGLTSYYNPDKDRISSNYEAPEKEKTVRSDLYSAGIILCQMLTKYYPDGEKFPSIKSLNPKISDKLISILSKAIEINPEKRYKNTTNFRKDLEKYLESFLKDNKPSSLESPKITRDLFDEKLKEEDEKTDKKAKKSLSTGMIVLIVVVIAALIAVKIWLDKNAENAIICSQNIYNINIALDNYNNDFREYPALLKDLTQKCMDQSNEELYEKPYLETGRECPSGNTYIYTTNYETYTLYCELHKDQKRQEEELPLREPKK